MRTYKIAAVGFLLATASTTLAYEWRSHNRMAANARAIFVPDPKTPRPIFPVEGELISFLRDHGLDLDTRAGDPFKDAFLDEDHTEGELKNAGLACFYTDRDCAPAVAGLSRKAGALPCSFDHFHPPLPLPLAQQDAVAHAHQYVAMAVKLYKAAICRVGSTEAELYKMWAARALGHAIHLVEDMGSPQHVLPENHAPVFGHGPSFHEYWAQNVWDAARTYDKPDGSGSKVVGFFEQAAELARVPRPGRLGGIMENMAAESRLFLSGSPYAPGTSLLLRELQRVYSGSQLDLHWVDVVGSRGQHLSWDLPSFTANFFPSYGPVLTDDRRHTYRTNYLFAEPDYQVQSQLTAPDKGTIAIDSFELSERVWAQGDAKAVNNPVTFDDAFHGLITHTTEAAAGAILAFWDEVKGYHCQCGDENPCRKNTGTAAPAAASAAAGASCPAPAPPGPYTPGRDNPDDTTGIVGNVSSVKVPAVSQFDAATRSAHWKQIAAVGVEKGLTSLIDFGRTMHLLELSQYNLVDADQEQLARGMGALERKYSVNIPRPEEDMSRAAHVAILDNGFAGEAGSALDALGWTHTSLPIVFDPLLLAEEQKVLFIPSGGLYGTAGSADLKERFRAYVEAGGTLVVMAQMRGEDFKTVPTPAGEELTAYGWLEVGWPA